MAELGLEEAGSSGVHDSSLNTVMCWGSGLHPWTEKIPPDSEQVPNQKVFLDRKEKECSCPLYGMWRKQSDISCYPTVGKTQHFSPPSMGVVGSGM